MGILSYLVFSVGVGSVYHHSWEDATAVYDEAVADGFKSGDAAYDDARPRSGRRHQLRERRVRHYSVLRPQPA